MERSFSSCLIAHDQGDGSLHSLAWEAVGTDWGGTSRCWWQWPGITPDRVRMGGCLRHSQVKHEGPWPKSPGSS